jgi:hypothetical protein
MSEAPSMRVTPTVFQGGHFTTFSLISKKEVLWIQFRNENVNCSKSLIEGEERRVWTLCEHVSPAYALKSRKPNQNESFDPDEPIFSEEILNWMKPKVLEDQKVGFI